jgi:hypothetical protein
MTKHKIFSLVKSSIRIVGCVIGAAYFRDTLATFAFWLLFVAELIGIVEEQYE